MTGVLFKILFIMLFSLKMLIKLGLDLINYSYLKKHAAIVPTELKALITAEKLQAINSYNIAKIGFRLAYFLYNSFLLLGFLFSPLYSRYTNWFAAFPIPYFLKGLFFFLTLAILTWLLDLPFDYCYHFRIEAHHGFNKYTMPRWIADQFKNIIVSSVITTIILSLIFLVWGDHFIFTWNFVFIGWLSSFLLVVLLMYLIPILLFPIFYKLQPLENETLKQNIAGMFTRSGFKVRGIFMADESKKSAHANALITGIGHSKTIILFDTLIDHYSDEEILAMIAHEIGHGKKGHLFKLMSLMMVELFLFILFASYLLSANFPYQAMGITKILYSGLFFAYIFFFDLLTFFVQPFFSSYSRALEYEADDYSKQLLGSGAPLQSSFKKLISNELDNINPHPWYEAFYYSHPTLLKRIQALNQ
jgi:STE24 endopeptidase